MFRVKAQPSSLTGRRSAIGEKDKKSLRNDFLSSCPLVSLADFENLAGPGQLSKLLTKKSSNSSVAIYFTQSNIPIIFVVKNGKTSYYLPTIFALQQLPNAIPCFVCPSKVSVFILRGASLMLPGCYRPQGGFAASGLKQGAVWGVRVSNNPIPFAVGLVAMDGTTADSQTTGMALDVFHYYDDLLWRDGPRSLRPTGFRSQRVFGLRASSTAPSVMESDVSADEVEDERIVNEQIHDPKVSIDAPDETGRTIKKISKQIDDAWDIGFESHQSESSLDNKKITNLENYSSILDDSSSQIQLEDDSKNNNSNFLNLSSEDMIKNSEIQIPNLSDNIKKNFLYNSDPMNEQKHHSENEEQNIFIPHKNENDDSSLSHSSNQNEDNIQNEFGWSVPPFVVDKLFEICFLESLRRDGQSLLLPMDASALVTRFLSILSSPEMELPLLKEYRSLGENFELPEWNYEIIRKLKIKNSSHKNIKQLFRIFQKQQIINVKEQRGVLKIVKINFKHPSLSIPIIKNEIKSTKLLTKHDDSKIETTQNYNSSPVSSTGQSGGKISIVTMYRVKAEAKSIFSSSSQNRPIQKDALLQQADVLESLKSHCARYAARQKSRQQGTVSNAQHFPELGSSGSNKVDSDNQLTAKSLSSINPLELPWGDLVRDDETIRVIVLPKAERKILKEGSENEKKKVLENITWKSVSEKFIQNSVRPVTIVLPHGKTLEDASANPDCCAIIESSTLPVIKVSPMRTRGHCQTKVSGLHYFPQLIDPRILAEQLAKVCAAAASVGEIEEEKGKRKPLGVFVQGTVTDQVVEFLECVYGFPKNMIIVTK